MRGLISEVAARHPRIHWVEDREPWERGGILIMHELCPPPHTHQITHRAEPGGSRSYRELNIMQSGASQDIDCFLFSSVEASKTETKNEDLLELRRLCLRCRLDHDRKKRPWVSKLPALWLQVFLLSLKKKGPLITRGKMVSEKWAEDSIPSLGKSTAGCNCIPIHRTTTERKRHVAFSAPPPTRHPLHPSISLLVTCLVTSQ